MGDDPTGAHSNRSLTDRLTIAEAATLLGVHRNTVRNRIKDGTYEAEIVVTERGPTYFIKRESVLNNLTTNTLSSASQGHRSQIVSRQGMEFVQELLRPFVKEVGEVREQLGAERARRELAEEKAAALEAELAEDRRRREVAELELGHAQRERAKLRRMLEAREDAPESPETAADATDRGDVTDDHSEAKRAQERRLAWGEKWEMRLFGVLVAIAVVSAILLFAVTQLGP